MRNICNTIFLQILFLQLQLTSIKNVISQFRFPHLNNPNKPIKKNNTKLFEIISVGQTETNRIWQTIKKKGWVPYGNNGWIVLWPKLVEKFGSVQVAPSRCVPACEPLPRARVGTARLVRRRPPVGSSESVQARHGAFVCSLRWSLCDVPRTGNRSRDTPWERARPQTKRSPGAILPGPNVVSRRDNPRPRHNLIAAPPSHLIAAGFKRKNRTRKLTVSWSTSRIPQRDQRPGVKWQLRAPRPSRDFSREVMILDNPFFLRHDFCTLCLQVVWYTFFYFFIVYITIVYNCWCLCLYLRLVMFCLDGSIVIVLCFSLQFIVWGRFFIFGAVLNPREMSGVCAQNKGRCIWVRREVPTTIFVVHITYWVSGY